MTRTRWQVAIAVVIVAARAAAAVWSDSVVTFDSERYRDGADPLAPFRVWDGYGPGVLAQMIHLMPLPVSAVVQAVLAATIWGFAAIYAASVATRRFSWPVFIIIQAWALSPWFLLWDVWVLTEALTIAGCALCAVGVAAAVGGARGASWVAVSGLAVALTTRPFTAAILLPLVIVALGWPVNAARLRSLGKQIAAVAILTIFAVWQVLSFAATDDAPFSYLPQPESLKQIQATDRLAGRGGLPGYLELARDDGMPRCAAVDAIVLSPTDHDKLKSLRDLRECPELDGWLAAGGLPWTQEIRYNPLTTAAALFSPEVWVDQGFAPYLLLDDRVLRLLHGSPLRLERSVMVVNVVMLVFAALFFVAALMSRGKRGFALFAVAVVTVVSIYVMAVDGIEYWRHVVPAFAVLPPLAVTLCCRSKAPCAELQSADRQLV